MMIGCWKVCIAVLLLQASLEAALSPKVTFGTFNVMTLFIPPEHESYLRYDKNLTQITAIQEDKHEKGNTLVAVGNALYTISSSQTTLLAGNIVEAGFRNGRRITALFDQISGLAQIENGDAVLISDKNNKCIRKLDRIRGWVTTYSGVCNKNLTSFFQSPWRRFISPRTMHYNSKTNTVYLLDERKIASKSLNTGISRTVYTSLSQVNDFVHDSSDNSLLISRNREVRKVSGYGSTRWTVFSIPAPKSLALHEGLLIATYNNSNNIKVFDTKQWRLQLLYTLCSNNGWQSYRMPRCTIRKPGAVAVIKDYLYIGTTPTFQLAQLQKIYFKVQHPAQSTTTSKPTTTRKRAFSISDSNSNSNSASDYSSSSNASGAGAMAGYIILIIIIVAAKITCITCCVYRCSRRLNHRRCHGTTVVAVSSGVTTTTTSMIPAPTANPYGRLQESYNPAVHGQFPNPPPYGQPAPGQYQPPPYYQPTSPGQPQPSGN